MTKILSRLRKNYFRLGRLGGTFLFFIFFFICNASNGQYIITIAGDGTMGIVGDICDGCAATSAKLCQPYHARPDHAGNVYIAEFGNNRIRKVNTAGIITTIAGTSLGASSGDGGPATAAGMDGPTTVVVDSAGNIYLSDGGGGTGPRIRKISSGIITTFAGGGPGLAGSGDGGPATAAAFQVISDAAFDNAGNMYISDEGKSNIRKIDAGGIIHTIAGNGSYGYSGDGGPATAAQLRQPNGVAVDRYGNVFIADEINNCVRKVDTSGIITQ